jgi:hypothetical protein
MRDLINGAAAMYLCTRDSGLRPAMGRPVGLRLNADGKSITVVMPKAICQPSLDNVKASPLASLGLTNPSSFESFQFKGRITATREAGPEEMAVKELYLSKFHNLLGSLGYPAPFVAGVEKLKAMLSPAPAYVFNLEVDEIYLQTPGPKAGAKLYPA